MAKFTLFALTLALLVASLRGAPNSSNSIFPSNFSKNSEEELVLPQSFLNVSIQMSIPDDDPETTTAQPTLTPLSPGFISLLRKNVALLGFNLNNSLPYCVSRTNLTNCKVNWAQLHPTNFDLPALFKNEYYTLNETTGECCFVFRHEFRSICFGPTDGLYQQVVLTKKYLDKHRLSFGEESHQVIDDVRLVLPFSPDVFLLVTGDEPNEFCLLNFYHHQCKPFVEMLKQAERWWN